MPLLTALFPSRRPFSRRAVLGLTVLTTLAGPGVAACSADSNKRPVATPSSKRAGPDPQLADVKAEAALIAQYDATLKAHPALRGRLQPLRSQHAVHLSALTKLIGGKGRIGVATSAVPADQTAALQALRAAEQAAAAARTRSCIAAAADRCGLLGSIAASEASHVELLS